MTDPEVYQLDIYSQQLGLLASSYSVPAKCILSVYLVRGSLHVRDLCPTHGVWCPVSASASSASAVATVVTMLPPYKQVTG